MSLYKPTTHNPGFTIVEMLIIAPIVILLIGAFISVIVNMTGKVLITRGADSLAYNIQDSLNRIEADVKLSTTFLAQSNITPTSPQGYDDGTAGFANVDPTNGNMLILNTLATTGNPIALTSGIVYLKDTPNSCSDPNQLYNKNTPMTMNVIYFVKNNTLWRRTVVPATYLSAGCNIPWQQPSCNPVISNAFCDTQDEALLDSINTGGFTLQYYKTASSTTADTTASDNAQTATQRNAALMADATVSASISVTKTIAGKDITQSGTIRTTRLDANASTIAVITPPTSAPVAPTVTATLSAPDNIVFNWGRVSNADNNYTVKYNIAGGSDVTGATDSNIITYTVGAMRGQVVCAKVTARNSVGTSPVGTACATIPNWYGLTYQNNWADYNGGYSTGAYTKSNVGVIALKGLIQRSGTPISGEPIANLPVGYRPAEQLMFQVDAGDASARLDIFPNGNIMYSTGSPAWLSLDGISFIPAGSSYTWTAISPLQNSWVNYNSGWATAGYTKDSLGRVFTKGVVAGGATTNDAIIGTLPAGYRPPDYLHLPTTSNNAFDVTGVDTSGNEVTKSIPQNSYRSIQHRFYATGQATWNNLTLQNGWLALAGYAAPQYAKGSDGLVTIKGLIRAGTTTGGTVIANLPAGYRPASRLLEGIACNLQFCRIDIMPNGDILAVANVSSTWTALEGLSFMAEQ